MADNLVSELSGELSGLHVVSQQELPSTEKLGTDELPPPDPSRIVLPDSREEHNIWKADYKQKKGIPCPCGDEAHRNLEKWYEDYLESSAEEKLLLEDKFNKAALEEKIQEVSSQVPVSNGYCPNCQKLLEEWPEIIKKVPEYHPTEREGPYQQPHYENTLEFEAGHRNGCQLLRSEEGYLNLTLTWPGLDNHCWLPADPLYCVQNYDHQLFTLRKESTHLAAHKDLSQLELAKKWLDACLETHESCKSTEDSQLPTRLIDVGSTPIRLVQSSDLTTKPRYATLSHCWGTQNFHKLQQGNLEEFMSAIPEEHLTKTFQDAIYITRSLGLRYLWIDSLCIIQLCDMDWRSESALMSSIYGGSTITIAAAGATDGTKGCFLKPPGFIGKVHIELTTGEMWDIAPSAFHRSVVKSHLAGRAWALQERLLSPRTLHFSKTELFWECRHCDASESFPEGLPKFEHQHMFHRERKPISEIWHTIVILYTGAQLTFAKDKMIAISGIAQKAFEENGDQYLAGLWRKDMETQLLWCQQSPGRRLLSGSEYRAPSWSWASVDEKGFVHYSPKSEGTKYAYYAHVLGANVVPAGKEEFGELVGGELQMSYSVMLAGELNKIQGGDWDGIDFSYYEVEINSPEDKKERFRVYPDSDELDGRDIYLLPVLETLGTGKYNKRNLKGLIVLPTGGKKGEYSRAGYFNISAFDEGHRKTQDRFLGLFEASGKTTAEAQCAKVLEEPEFEAHNFVVPWVKLPFILGTDVAGEIVEVGKGVTRFKVGDRVVAHATGLNKPINLPSQGGFQEYTVLHQDMTSDIPEFVSYEAACVMPLGLSTAACALFQKDNLALPFPTTFPTPSKTLLIWGGATSVGFNAIQLARAAGYEVITTASPKNNAYLKRLGAAEVFDYHSPTAVRDIIAAFKNRQVAGAISVGAGSMKACIEVLGACQGTKLVAQCTLDLPPFPNSVFGFPPFLFGFVIEMISGTIKSRMMGVSTKFINWGDLVGKEVGKAIYEDFLPRALDARTIVPARILIS
ncbi:Dehydrogenase [Lachnellula subtilissima]|uniref:Dehydrogenase n=1 Tax=Lachnellula subtilissima TaxID=602034 RepID=A0A8H8RP51_9HELO|nr:Dehydrogenase [Lachnellula subtilissima]